MKALFSVVFFSFFFSFYSFSQMKVKDKNTINQIKSIEYRQWKFTPNYYYYSWYKKKVLGVSIKMPGLGIHEHGIGGIGGGDSYVCKDRRNIKQELPMLAFLELNHEDAEEQGEETDIVYKQELTKFTDRSFDIQYELTKKERNNLISAIAENLLYYANNGGDDQHINSLSGEVLRIRGNIQIIHDSHMLNSKKREAYIAFHKELSDVLNMTCRLNSLNKVLNLK